MRVLPTALSDPSGFKSINIDPRDVCHWIGFKGRSILSISPNVERLRTWPTDGEWILSINNIDLWLRIIMWVVNNAYTRVICVFFFIFIGRIFNLYFLFSFSFYLFFLSVVLILSLMFWQNSLQMASPLRKETSHIDSLKWTQRPSSFLSRAKVAQ